MLVYINYYYDLYTMDDNIRRQYTNVGRYTPTYLILCLFRMIINYENACVIEKDFVTLHCLIRQGKSILSRYREVYSNLQQTFLQRLI